MDCHDWMNHDHVVKVVVEDVVKILLHCVGWKWLGGSTVR